MVAVSIGLLLARLIIGWAIAAHGLQKLFGMFGGHGLSGTGTSFDFLGYRPGKLFALAAGFGEFGGGLLTAIGFGWSAGAGADYPDDACGSLYLSCQKRFLCYGRRFRIERHLC